MTVTLKDINYIETGEVGWQNIIDNFETLRTMPESGRCATYTIAANDSFAHVKAQADYVCSGVDDNVLINTVISKLSDVGGHITFSEGTFALGDKIAVDTPGITLSGAGVMSADATPFKGTVFYLQDNADSNMIEITGTKCHIFNMSLHGNKSNQAGTLIGIYAHAGLPEDLRIHDCYVHFIKGFGIQVDGNHGFVHDVWVELSDNYGFHIVGNRNSLSNANAWQCGGGLHVQGSENSIISSYVFETQSNAGIAIGYDATSVGNIVADCRIFKAAMHGIWIVRGQRNIIANNTIRGAGILANDTYGGIALGTDAGIHSTHNQIIGNKIFSEEANKPKYGICEADANQNYNLIQGNSIENIVTSGIYKQGANTMVNYNMGHKTENSGTATLVSGTTSIAVAHGLAATPVAGDIVVTPIEAWGNMTTYYIDTYTATHFTIHSPIDPAQDVDFAWKGIVL